MATYYYSSLFKKDDVRITQGYKGVNHKGLDLSRGVVRQPLYLPNKAVEGYVWKILPGYSYGGKYYDKSPIIYIKHKDGSGSRYIHSYPEDVKVKVGQTIKAGDQICCTGNSGYSGGDHIHFEWLKKWDDINSHTDPTPFIINDKITLHRVGTKLITSQVMNIRDASGNDIGDAQANAVCEIKAVDTYHSGYQWYIVDFADKKGVYIADTKFNSTTTLPVTNLDGSKEIIKVDTTQLENTIKELEAKVSDLLTKLRSKDDEITNLIVLHNENTEELEGYEECKLERDRYESDYELAVDELNKIRRNRFLWLAEFLEKLVPKK